MRGTIRKLFTASGLLALLALSASYYGREVAEAQRPAAAARDTLAGQFAADPGDGWMLAGGFLMVVALAIASAAFMLWMRERQSGK